MVLLTYANNSGGARSEYTVNTSVVLLLFGCSQGARKVSEKCIKGTPAVLRGCLQGTTLSITAPDYFSWITSPRQAQFLADLYLSFDHAPFCPDNLQD